MVTGQLTKRAGDLTSLLLRTPNDVARTLLGGMPGRVLTAAKWTLLECFSQPARPGLAPRQLLDNASSVVDCLDAKLLDAFEVVLHRLKDIGGVPFPVREFAHDQWRVARAVRLRRVAGEFLVREFGSSSMGPVGSTM